MLIQPGNAAFVSALIEASKAFGRVDRPTTALALMPPPPSDIYSGYDIKYLHISPHDSRKIETIGGTELGAGRGVYPYLQKELFPEDENWEDHIFSFIHEDLGESRNQHRYRWSLVDPRTMRLREIHGRVLSCEYSPTIT